MHVDDTAHSGIMLIKNNIKHNKAEKYRKDFLQAITIVKELG